MKSDGVLLPLYAVSTCFPALVTSFLHSFPSPHSLPMTKSMGPASPSLFGPNLVDTYPRGGMCV